MSIRDALRSAWQHSRGSVSLAIAWVCVALFLGVTVLDLLGVVPRHEVVSVLGLSYVGLVRRRFYFELVTAPLLHANVTHLLFNVLALWMLGPAVEERLGKPRYLVFSGLCAVSGMLGFLVVNWHSGQVAIGYSGVIFGILVAQAIYYPDSVVAVFAFFPLRMKYAAWLLGAVELYLMVSPEGAGVAHAAHLCGAAAAALFLGATRGLTVPRERARIQRKPAAPLSMSRRPRGKRADVPREL